MENKDVYLKLDKMANDLSEMKVSAAKMEVDLRHHIAGTIQNREEIVLLKRDMSVWKGVLLAFGAICSFLAPIITLVVKAYIEK